MKTLHVLMSSLFLVLMASCATTSKVSTEEMQQLEDLAQSRAFRFEAEWAMPLVTNSLSQINSALLLPPGSTVNQINLNGNNNYIKIQGDSASVYLPYFGERQMGGSYAPRNTGIHFEGIVDEMEMVKNEKKNSYEISFDMEAEESAEVYQVYILVFPNLSANVNINSNQRFPIRYKGKVSKFMEEEL
ncbi:DUF4251 domain-containing protein [Allomuricauda sp. SCSIO 65647]|uniref:DUF4251 domain-containing protein n=1 Tax=Allomuricauda sp. SCSIO 65647 TaxID=2908843 RepID=UPI001F248AD4|nr:DUF4251 domain-containing protein [Muricauda sp. SCSIO 65647]UJH67337.1 DUF4251 domain-containing protein [Muricauda sp. SCSIO 65647]